MRVSKVFCLDCSRCTPCGSKMFSFRHLTYAKGCLVVDNFGSYAQWSQFLSWIKSKNTYPSHCQQNFAFLFRSENTHSVWDRHCKIGETKILESLHHNCIYTEDLHNHRLQRTQWNVTSTRELRTMYLYHNVEKHFKNTRA